MAHSFHASESLPNTYSIVFYVVMHFYFLLLHIIYTFMWIEKEASEIQMNSEVSYICTSRGGTNIKV